MSSQAFSGRPVYWDSLAAVPESFEESQACPEGACFFEPAPRGCSPRFQPPCLLMSSQAFSGRPVYWDSLAAVPESFEESQACLEGACFFEPAPRGCSPRFQPPCLLMSSQAFSGRPVYWDSLAAVPESFEESQACPEGACFFEPAPRGCSPRFQPPCLLMSSQAFSSRKPWKSGPRQPLKPCPCPEAAGFQPPCLLMSSQTKKAVLICPMRQKRAFV